MPEEAAKRRSMFNAIAPVLEKYGFVPLETPTVEFAETILGGDHVMGSRFSYRHLSLLLEIR